MPPAPRPRCSAAAGARSTAVERAVRALEDDPLFNAGTGACLDAEGHVELDASIMEGTSLRAGAVCALAGFATPVSIARAALDDGRHVLYAAHGARLFALSRGFVEVAEETLVTPAARAAFAAVQSSGGATGWAGGTVGAVARDAAGGTAAATSTGGMINKRVGRVGDSPLIGAGTYADDAAGAISTTGHGEGMIRLGVAASPPLTMGGDVPAEEALRSAIEALPRASARPAAPSRWIPGPVGLGAVHGHDVLGPRRRRRRGRGFLKSDLRTRASRGPAARVSRHRSGLRLVAAVATPTLQSPPSSGEPASR